MSININVEKSPIWKYGAGKMWSLGLSMTLLLVVLMAGCGSSYTPPPTPTLPPTLTSVGPSSGTQGQAVPVTLTGTYFGSGSTISLSGTGITVSNTTVASSTSITATFSIAASATTGPLNVTVTSSGMTSGSQTFTVTLLPITVSSTNPAIGAIAVPTNEKIIAVFSKPMDPATITTATFLVAGVTGVVTCNAACNIATFAPTSNLTASTTFTATITTGAKDPAGNSMASPFVWSFTTGTTTDVTAPTVSSTNPANAATGVTLSQRIAATFSEVMDSSSITTTTFTLKQGTTAVAGTLSYAGRTATFTPTANLAASTLYTSTITTGATDLAGNPLGSNFAWTFTTGTGSNASAPTVTSTVPAASAAGVGINQTINATFSTGMDPSTINTGTFTVAGPGVTPVTGTVTYNATSNVATFTPTSSLTSSATFTATVTTGAKDLSGNPLAANKVWTFTTGATTTGQAPVNLRSLSTFVAVAGAGLTNSNSGGTTTLNGDVGLNPTATCLGDGIACAALDPKINGTLYANDPAGIAAQAKADLLLAYSDATGRPPGTLETDLSGMVLAPGVYTSGSTMTIAVSGVLTLDAQGDANAVWIFQVGSALTVNNSAQVLLINGAKASNVFWAIGSSSTLGTSVSFKGSILAQSSNSLGTLSVVEGRVLCSTGQVTLLSNTITVPAP
jgi:hypothetical protein